MPRDSPRHLQPNGPNLAVPHPDSRVLRSLSRDPKLGARADHRLLQSVDKPARSFATPTQVYYRIPYELPWSVKRRLASSAAVCVLCPKRLEAHLLVWVVLF
jgi:hypothetical protein